MIQVEELVEKERQEQEELVELQALEGKELVEQLQVLV